MLVAQYVFGITTLQQSRPTKARRMRRRKSVCAWSTAVSSTVLAGWKTMPGVEDWPSASTAPGKSSNTTSTTYMCECTCLFRLESNR